MNAETPGELGIGEAIRALRRRRGLSTRALARIAGVSQPLLSGIENARVAPSVMTLYAIAEALGTGPAELLPRSGEAALAGHAPGTGATSATTTLMHAVSGHRLEAYRIELPAGYRDESPFQHPGEDHLHVLDGRMALEHGETAVELVAGDDIWLDGATPHAFVTPRGSGAIVQVVTAR